MGRGMSAPGQVMLSYRKDCEKTPLCSSSSSSSSLLDPGPGKRVLAERSAEVLHSTELLRMGGGAAASTLSVKLSPSGGRGRAGSSGTGGSDSGGPAGRSCLSIQAL